MPALDRRLFESYLSIEDDPSKLFSCCISRKVRSDGRGFQAFGNGEACSQVPTFSCP